jgi:quercetin dioxygenase-like cupin family protein
LSSPAARRSPLAVAAHPGHSAPTAAVTPLISKAFANIPGKEGLMVVVDYAPGAVDPVHRHDAHVFVYVLEGEIIMQVKGGKEVRLKPGETFYEDPDDIHVVGKNASDTEPAKFLVFFVKDEGAPPLTPVE